ncbi:zinc finger protein 862-like [Penaeus indicus]|uniref:zinc finger protein 862-like n=1 Tax=Penaeus indicus TaxID=29960 RepID=UPI00300C5C34
MLFKGTGDSKQGFRKDSLKFHKKSKAHVKCQYAIQAQAAPKSTPMAKVIKRMNADNVEKIKRLFNTTCYVVTQHLAFRKFESLCELQNMNGVQLGKNYINDHGCKDFIMAIASVLKSETKEEVSHANYFSILADGSTDSAIIEQEGVYIRFVNKGKPITKLIQFVAVKSSTSQGVYDGIKSALESIGVTPDIQARKQIGLNLDRASVDMGHKSGVQVSARKDVPHTLVIHCINHNLELAILDIKKGIPYLQKFEETLQLVFKFYYYSPKRRRELYSIAQILDDKLVHYGGIQQIRWLASQERALKALSTNIKTTIVHLEDIASTGNRKDSAEANGILKHLQTTKFMKYLHFMIDYSAALSTMSQAFQVEYLLITEVMPQLTTALLKLGSLKSKPGPNLKSFLKKYQDGEFKELKLKGELESGCEPMYSEMIQGAMDFIDARFGKMQSPPHSYFQIFHFSTWPYASEELADYGTQELEGILNHFAALFGEEQRCSTLEEWLPFKLHVSKMRTSTQLEVFADMLLSKPTKFINILHIVEIMMAISVSTAGVERGFSNMNIEKNSKRTQMNQNTLNAVMEININGPPLSEFNPLTSVEFWLQSGPGQRHIGGHAVSESVTETVVTDDCVIADDDENSPKDVKSVISKTAKFSDVELVMIAIILDEEDKNKEKESEHIKRGIKESKGELANLYKEITDDGTIFVPVLQNARKLFKHSAQ